MMKVRDQVVRMQRSVAAPEPDLTVKEYRGMDKTISIMEVVSRASYNFGAGTVFSLRRAQGKNAGVGHESGDTKSIDI
jgi:hypothetical protein